MFQQTMDFNRHFFDFTLSETEIYATAGVSTVILMLVGYIGMAILKEDRRKLCWVVSLCNSLVLLIVGTVYILVKVPTIEGFFWFGDRGRSVFHSIDNVSVIACIWFTMANLFDLIFGLIYYRQHLDPLTAYVHHTVYVWILITSMTGNGGFARFAPFASGFVYMFIEELPTFLLALGAVFPSFRTDIGFGVTFFWLRLVYHFYMLAYSVYLRTDAIIPFLYVLTLALHVYWYYNWMRKYGLKLLFGAGKAEKSREKAV